MPVHAHLMVQDGSPARPALLPAYDPRLNIRQHLSGKVIWICLTLQRSRADLRLTSRYAARR
jgi:hypothetical protein